MSVAGDGPDLAFVRVEGHLRAPVDMELRRQVEALLGRGLKSLVIDLARVADVDAAGIGELVHVYRRALAVNADLRLVHATRRVCRLLDQAGLVELLAADSCCQERCS